MRCIITVGLSFDGKFSLGHCFICICDDLHSGSVSWFWWRRCWWILLLPLLQHSSSCWTVRSLTVRCKLTEKCIDFRILFKRKNVSVYALRRILLEVAKQWRLYFPICRDIRPPGINMNVWEGWGQWSFTLLYCFKSMYFSSFFLTVSMTLMADSLLIAEFQSREIWERGRSVSSNTRRQRLECVDVRDADCLPSKLCVWGKRKESNVVMAWFYPCWYK